MKRDYTSVLQLTDLHLFADPTGLFNNINTRDSFAKVLNHIQQHYENPDIIIITGDLVHDGAVEAYQFIAVALKYSLYPFIMCWVTMIIPKMLLRFIHLNLLLQINIVY